MKICEYLDNLMEMYIFNLTIAGADQKMVKIDVWTEPESKFISINLYNIDRTLSFPYIEIKQMAKSNWSNYAYLDIFSLFAFEEKIVFRIKHTEKLEINNTVTIRVK